MMPLFYWRLIWRHLITPGGRKEAEKEFAQSQNHPLWKLSIYYEHDAYTLVENKCRCQLNTLKVNNPALMASKEPTL